MGDDDVDMARTPDPGRTLDVSGQGGGYAEFAVGAGTQTGAVAVGVNFAVAVGMPEFDLGAPVAEASSRWVQRSSPVAASSAVSVPNPDDTNNSPSP